MGLPSAIRYLRECYREDNVRGGRWDLFAEQVRHRAVFEGVEQLADGIAGNAVFPPGHQFDEVYRDVALRAGEFELLYGLLFVTGRATLPGSDQERRICAPLFVYPARLVGGANGYPAVEIELPDRRVNTALLDMLCGDGVAVTAALGEEIPADVFGEREAMAAERVLRQHIPSLDCSEMRIYPQLLDRAALSSMAKSVGGAGAEWRLLPAAALALWPKSEAARGIIAEMASIAEAPRFSASLEALLGDGSSAPAPDPVPNPPIVPAVLSESQEAIVCSARRHPLTFVNGPPGTGKSFTIAAVALDHLARGESVLVVAKTDNAVDVVGAKIEATHGVSGCVVRAGKRQYLRSLKREIETILGGARTAAHPSDTDRASGERRRRRLPGELAKMTEHFDAVLRREEKRGEVLASRGGGLLAGLRRGITRWRASRSRPVWELIADYEALLGQVVDASRQALEMRRDAELRACLGAHRVELQRFLSAIRARRGTRKEKLFGQTNFTAVLRAFPIWLVKLADVARVLPLGAELFDVVIIDEATQCDMASAMPALQRARRAVVAGDPKQLRHLSFLSRRRQAQLANKFGVSAEDAFSDYRSTSLLDLVDSRIGQQEQVGFLNEHFRSAPAVIEFSNAQFYGGRLNVMTDRPAAGAVPAAIFVHRVVGSRSESGVNRSEVEAVLAKLRELAAAGGELSVGVLSPFRAQVDALREALTGELSAGEFAALTDRHQLRVGTAHSFQGDERDVMLLSFAVDAGSASAGMRFLERPDVFNVAVTRARREQHLFFSLEPGELPAGSLLRAYLSRVLAPPDPARGGVGAAAEASWRDVVAELRSVGCEVFAGPEVAGVAFDLVAVRGDACVAIDLIGFPGRGIEALALERYKMFRRAGIPVFPLAYGDWEFRREGCLNALRLALGNP